MSTTSKDPAIVEEHFTASDFGDESLYSQHTKQLDALITRFQSLESLDGVLEVHVGIVPSGRNDGKRVYLHHFRTIDTAARERVFLAAHSCHADFLLAVSESARQTHEHMSATHGKKDEKHVKHKLSSERANAEVISSLHSDWTTKLSGSPAARHPAVRMGVTKAKEGTTPEVLDECVKEMSGLPTRFPLLAEVSIGRSDSSRFLGPQYYPEDGVTDWDLGFVFSYASADDRRELDSDPEFEKIRKKWRSVLGDNYQVWDLDVNRAAA